MTDIRSLLSRKFLGDWDGLVVSNNAPALVKLAATIAKFFYGEAIQICDGVNDEVSILAMINGTPPFAGASRYCRKYRAIGPNLHCDAALSWPSMQDCEVDFGSAYIYFDNIAGDNLTFDSMMNCDIRIHLIIGTNTGANATVRWKPINGVPYDGIVAGVATRLNINSLAKATNPQQGTAFILDTTNTAIQGCDIRLEEINYYNIGLANVGAVNPIVGNNIRLGWVQQTLTCAQLGATFQGNELWLYPYKNIAAVITGLSLTGDGNKITMVMCPGAVVDANRAVILNAGADSNVIELDKLSINTGITDNSGVLTNKWIHYRMSVSCKVFHNAGQNINDSADTALAFNSESWDTDTMHDTAVNNSRITAKIAGIYMLITHLIFDVNANGIRSCRFRINGPGGTETGCMQVASAGAAASTRITCSSMVRLNVNDYVETIVYQNSGGVLAVTASADISPFFMAVRVGD